MTSKDVIALFEDLPGSELITQGLEDVAAGRESIAGELVKIGSPRLRDCGVHVPVSPEDALDADHRLYRLLGAEHGNAAHSQYNALVSRLVSFERALEHRVSRAGRTALAAS
jgi:hypothetical protein